MAAAVAPPAIGQTIHTVPATVQPQQFQTVHQYQPIHPTVAAQPLQQHQPLQQFQFVQHVQPVPMLAQLSQPIEVAEISTDDQLNDSQDDEEQPSSLIEESTGVSALANSGDQSMLTLNRLNAQQDGETTGQAVADDSEKLEEFGAVDPDEVAG